MRYVSIANTDVQILEYQGKRVMTSTQIINLFEHKDLVLNHRKSGRQTGDFIKLDNSEAKTFLTENNLPFLKGGRGLTLWGEKAVREFARHAKSIITQRVMNELEEKYFYSKDTQMEELPIVAHEINMVEEDEPLRIEHVDEIGVDENGMVDGRRLHAFLQVGTRYNDWFERMCEYGFTERADFYSKMSKTSPYSGRPSINHSMTIDMAKEISMLQRNERGKQARLYFIECEKRSKQKPMTTMEMVAAQAMAMVEQERKTKKLEADMKQVQEVQRIQNARLDVLNGVCIEGTPRQKLKAMVDCYSHKNGLQYRVGWLLFKTKYNTAFSENLQLQITNYEKAQGKKKVTIPEYLEATGKLDDALRVAEKMLNSNENED